VSQVRGPKKLFGELLWLLECVFLPSVLLLSTIKTMTTATARITLSIEQELESSTINKLM
jgi:hypothetical protein